LRDDPPGRGEERPAAGHPEAAGMNPSELEDFYRRLFLPLVRRAVRKHGVPFEDAGDIVQDAFVIAVGKLDPSRNPKAWLYQVVDHLAVNFQRKTLRRAKLVAKWDPPARASRSPLNLHDE